MEFNDLLEKLEENEEILNFKFQKSQIPMYLPIRFILLQSLINKEFNLSNPHVKANKKSINEVLHYIYHTLISNLFFAPKKDIYIFSSGIVNIYENEKYTNRLYDNFNSLFPEQTQIIESSVKRSYLLPKKERIYFKDLIDIAIVLIGKCSPMKNKDAQTIQKFMNYLRSYSSLKISDRTYHEIQTVLRKASKKMDISILLYRWFLKYKKPKLIIVEDGHYGGYSYIFKVAKELGISTTEYQHGYVGLSHPAYNYHENLLKEIRSFLPEIFLTHGQYWSDRVRISAKKITIGFPHLTHKLEKNIFHNAPLKRIIFISGGTVHTELYNLILNSINNLHALGFEVILRPHPSEKPAIDERYGGLINKNVVIDTQELYESLAMAEIVVSMEVSTVLFEAIYFTKKIHLVKTSYTSFYEPESVFIPFENFDQLFTNIQNNATINIPKDYFWDSDWKNNYKNFVKDVLE